MIAKGMTINNAAHRWVAEMNAYPQDMIQTLMQAKIDDWHEVTLPSSGDRVYVFNLPEEKPDGQPYESTEEYGAIAECLENEIYRIEMDDGESILVKEDDFEVERYTWLPMWGWLWSFGDSADDYWMEEMDGIKKMSECGFRIYEHEEWGYFFGIDGCGYSFYEEHWIPAYKARGLKWHDEVAEQEHQMMRKGYEKKTIDSKEYWCNGDEIVEEVVK